MRINDLGVSIISIVSIVSRIPYVSTLYTFWESINRLPTRSALGQPSAERSQISKRKQRRSSPRHSCCFLRDQGAIQKRCVAFGE
jgi:hypothetical protein